MRRRLMTMGALFATGLAPAAAVAPASLLRVGEGEVSEEARRVEIVIRAP